MEYILGCSVSCFPKGLGGGLNSRTEIIFRNDKATSKRERERVRRVGEPAMASHSGNTDVCPS